MSFDITKQPVDEIFNWTFPGLTMYYRDSELPPDVVEKYIPGSIFRARTFVDVSNYAGKLTKNTRFAFASTKAAPLYKFNPATDKWKLHTMNANSYFKVMDVYKKGDKTQIFLLHIPARGVEFFMNTVVHLGETNLEQQLIDKARISLDQKMEMEPVAALEEAEWVHRTWFPIGLDNNNNFFPFHPEGEMFAEALPLYNAIFKMTNDTELNIPTIVKS